MRKKSVRKLSLTRETLQKLEKRTLDRVQGQGGFDTEDRTCTLDRTCFCTLDRTCLCTDTCEPYC